MKTLYEQIFDRRCSAAAVGNEVDVRFFDEILSHYQEIDDLEDAHGQEIHEIESAPCYECQKSDDKIEDLEDEIEELNEEVSELKAEISALQDQVINGSS